jgi:hypothetical protein
MAIGENLSEFAILIAVDYGGHLPTRNSSERGALWCIGSGEQTYNRCDAVNSALA